VLKLEHRTAVVTGAAGGIGRGIAAALARRSCHLALADIDESGLNAVAAELAAPGLRISIHRLDVADAAAVAAFPAAVTAMHPGVDILVNNAGVALGGTFEQVAPEDFEWLFSINFWGVVRMTRAFLPLLRRSGEARLVNLSSLFGMIAPPGQAAYVASKFAVRGFSESLRHELANSRVGVTVVHPGGVATSIARNARVPRGAPAGEVKRKLREFDAFLRMNPEDVGETIVRAVERRKARIIIGAEAKLAALLERLMPVNYWTVLGRKLK
jgi:short-subunit dehydrogenase